MDEVGHGGEDAANDAAVNKPELVEAADSPRILGHIDEVIYENDNVSIIDSNRAAQSIQGNPFSYTIAKPITIPMQELIDFGPEAVGSIITPRAALAHRRDNDETIKINSINATSGSYEYKLGKYDTELPKSTANRVITKVTREAPPIKNLYPSLD